MLAYWPNTSQQLLPSLQSVVSDRLDAICFCNSLGEFSSGKAALGKPPNLKYPAITLDAFAFHAIRSSPLFKSYLLFALATVASLSSTAYSAVATDGNSDQVSDAYAQLIQAEHQLLKSELAVEAKKSANFEKLLADGHASWLESRQHKLVVDILKAKLAAYEKFESQATATLTGRKIELESIATDSIDARPTTIQELQQQLKSLRQAEAKLANGVATLPADDSWAEGYRLRLALTGDQADVVAAKISLLEQLNALQKETIEASGFVSTTETCFCFGGVETAC